MLKPRVKHFLFALLAAPLVLGPSACGGSESLVHIEGSSAKITRPMLDHWMRALAGSDFRASVGTKGPVGLVSEPADYSRCIEAAKKVIPRTYTGKFRLSEAAISTKCHLLHETIKVQALEFLIAVYWTALQAKEQGISVSDGEFHKGFERFSKEFYKSPAKRLSYLAERHMVLSDALFQYKRNILAQRLQPKFDAEVKEAGGSEKAFARIALVHYHDLISKTTCQAGYVIASCRGYHEPAVGPPSAAVILEGFAGAVG